MAFFKAIVNDLGLQLDQVNELKGAIDRKDEAGLRELLKEWGIGRRHAVALDELPHLCGGEEILERAADLAPNIGAHRAIENLKQVYDLLSAQGLAERVIIDLGEVRGLNYYTGITFEGFSPGLGFSICNGGRYDELIGLYGRPLPAVGFAFGVERVLLALEEQGKQEVDLTPHLLVAAEVVLSSREALQRLRGKGFKIECDVMARDEAGLLEYAQIRGITHILVDGDEEGGVLLTAGGRQRVSWEALEEMMR
jgi:ATP phosphoribosyltransferase regulatory subunit